MAKGTYLGGGMIINAGLHCDPGGRGVSGRGSPALKGSQRMPDGVIAAKPLAFWSSYALRKASGFITSGKFVSRHPCSRHLTDR
jgi:hypothetical protein